LRFIDFSFHLIAFPDDLTVFLSGIGRKPWSSASIEKSGIQPFRHPAFGPEAVLIIIKFGLVDVWLLASTPCGKMRALYRTSPFGAYERA
jgi:hypothetical protein